MRILLIVGLLSFATMVHAADPKPAEKTPAQLTAENAALQRRIAADAVQIASLRTSVQILQTQRNSLADQVVDVATSLTQARAQCPAK